MAKKSKINQNEKRRELIDVYAKRRAELKASGDYLSLQKLPRNSSRTRLRNRDMLDGRPRGYLRKFGISRVKFRQMANRGEIPGIKKASW